MPTPMSDMGTYGSVTPYVGAGIGGTKRQVGQAQEYELRDRQSGETATRRSKHGGRDKWRFTYALMAGASIDVTCNVKADLGYRFRHVVGGDMFGYEQKRRPWFPTRASTCTKPAPACAIPSAAASSLTSPVDYPVEQPVYK